MSADIYAHMATERLIDLFVAAAKQSGVGRLYSLLEDMRSGAPPPPFQPTTPEQKTAAAKVREIGAQLNERLSIEQMRGLMDGGDLDVRTCAAGQFFSKDEEWASSTWVALSEDLPTHEIVRFRAGARRPPPETPCLQDMSDDELLARFEDAATRLDWTRFLDYVEDPNDLATRNRLIDEGRFVLREFKARGLLERLIPLLDGVNDIIRYRAAVGCLRIAEPQAIATLEAIAAKNNFDASIFAKSTLQHWRQGKALVDGL